MKASGARQRRIAEGAENGCAENAEDGNDLQGNGHGEGRTQRTTTANDEDGDGKRRRRRKATTANMPSEMKSDRILQGDCIEILASLPDESADAIFADPPYNLQLAKELWRPNLTKVDAVNDQWDQFDSFAAYDEFTTEWLSQCRRVLKSTGSIWVIGSYHNIYRVGRILMDLGYWILNDIVWVKSNPMPNFRGVRFTNAHETLLWAKKSEDAKGITFNYQAMKQYNDGKQERSDWTIPICSGNERIQVNGEKAHPTQKPEALLERVIVASTRVGDLILDPFLGSGTTAAVAKRLGRQWLGIEAESSYVEIAQARIDAVRAPSAEELDQLRACEHQPKKRIPFAALLGCGLVCAGDELVERQSGAVATVCEDGSLNVNGTNGSIHKTAATVRDAPAANGWACWQYRDGESGGLRSIDELREKVRRGNGE